MAGVSTGPRQFQLMTPFNTLKDGGLSGNAGSGWQFSSLPAGSGGMCWITRKLDLRAFNGSDKANGLDLLAITVQEASPFFQVVDDQEETGGLFTLDVLTTVEMDDLAIAYWCQPGLHHFMTPGFLYSPSVGASAERIDEMSPSQVIWGLWRAMGIDRNMTAVETQPVLRTYTSGNFGGGEVMVSPQVYWTRIVIATSPDDTVYIPSANLHMAVNALDLNDGQEIIQMMRSSGR